MPTGPGCADACTTPLPLGRPGLVTQTTAPPAGQAATGEAGPRPTTARTRPARVDRTSGRHRPGGTGPVKRRAADSDADARPSRTARKLIRVTGQSRRAARGPGGKRWCQTGKEGGTGPRIRARSAAPKLSTRITAATGPPLKRPPGPGSHCDGPEACSPGEVRAGARSLDGRGRGVQLSPSTARSILLRVGHHVQGPGTEAPAAAAR